MDFGLCLIMLRRRKNIITSRASAAQLPTAIPIIAPVDKFDDEGVGVEADRECVTRK